MQASYLNIFLAALCVAVSLPAAAVSPVAGHPAWYGKPDCRIAPVDEPPIEGLTWRGACRDGYADGPGELEWRDRDKTRNRLDATLVRGEIQGEATLKWDDGATYVGGFAHGRPNGQGYFRSRSAQYEGGIVDGKQDGYGIQLLGNGDRYEGDWKHGRPNGRGRFIYALGGSYEGEFKDGKFHGHGVLVHAGSGRRYEGEFVDGHAAGASAAPLPEAGQYALHREEPETGTNIPATVARGSDVPLDRGYQEMTPEQRSRINARYAALEEGDEPSYPLHGPKRFFELVSQAVGRYETEGLLYVFVRVGADGRAISVSTKGIDNEKMRYFVSVAAMSLEYKPAVCRGKPCEMLVPFYLDMQLVR